MQQLGTGVCRMVPLFTFAAPALKPPLDSIKRRVMVAIEISRSRLA
jgi:hypothetical protein